MKIKDNQLTFFKKITGTTFPDLAGLNKFKPKGDAVLAMLGYVTEPFDEFYTKRGALAEKLAFMSLTKRNHKCVTYDPKQIHYDNFPDNPYFGGMIDIEIPSENTLYEIKSKNIKDYDKISKYGDIVQENQALHYGYLRNYKEVHIMWIFFDDVSENEIRNHQPLSTYRNLKMFEKPLTVNYDEQRKLHTEALKYYVHCMALQSIPLEDVSDKYLELLKVKRPNSNQNQPNSGSNQNGNSTVSGQSEGPVQLKLDL